MEARAHAENAAEIPVNGRRPCCDKVAVAGDIHLRRSGLDDVKVDDENVGVAGVYGPLYAGEEHDGGIIRKCVDGKSRLHDYQRQRVLVVCCVGGILAQVADGAAADTDDTVNARKMLRNGRCVFGGAMDDAVIGLSYDEPLDLILCLE